MPKSVWKIVKVIKMDCEEWGEPQIDEASLYRHVEEMLDLEREPSESAPAAIVEKYVEDILSIEWTVTVDNETFKAPRRTEEEIRAAADWAWIIFRDLFGEYPPTCDDEGYGSLVQQVLEMRRPHVVERLPPLC